MTDRFAAVILSAGLSTRMGTFKPMMPLGGRPLITRALETVSCLPAASVVVVVGHRADQVTPLVRAAGARAVYNPDYAQGMYASIRAGVRRLPPTVDAFFLLPVDIPLVRTATLERLIRMHRDHPGRILYPCFGGRRGHPPLIPAALSGEILRRPDDGGLREVLADHEDAATDVVVADANILFDLDTPAAYTEAQRRFDRRTDPSAEECHAILSSIHPARPAVIRHGRQVQRAAVAICRAMNRSGAGLNADRVAAAALLHDIAKGAPDHALAGGRLLASLGFEGAGDVVAAHTDLPEDAVDPVTEAAVVYLADKLVAGDRFVSLASRFDNAMQRFGDDPRARAAVIRRRTAAMAVKAAVTRCTGQPLEALLAAAGCPLPPERP